MRRVRALPTERRPYLIILTARGDKADVVTGLKAGANDYLSKPFDQGELQMRIELGRQMIELQSALAAKIDELRGALERIKTLRGILPICANCKKIRDDKGYWNQLEVYIRDRSQAEFTHGICPECEPGSAVLIATTLRLFLAVLCLILLGCSSPASHFLDEPLTPGRGLHDLVLGQTSLRQAFNHFGKSAQGESWSGPR